MNWNKYQKQIFNEINASDSNILVEARAGCGKTTTLTECINLIPEDKKILMLAFNKKIVKELNKRIKKPNCKIKTFHSLAYSYNIDYYKGTGIKFNENKIKDSLEDFFYNVPEDKLPLSIDFMIEKHTLAIELIRSNMIEFDYESSDEENKEIIEKILDMYGENDYYIWKGVILTQLKKIKGNKHVLDYTDLIINCGIKKGIVNEKYDYILIDECQDLTIAQHAFIKKLIKKGKSRIIAIGDPLQQIYGFAGSDIRSFNKFVDDYNCKKLTLPISYRCPKITEKLVKDFGIEDFYVFENNFEGSISEKKYDDINIGDVIIVRHIQDIINLGHYFFNLKIKMNFVGFEFEGIYEEFKNLNNKITIDSFKDYINTNVDDSPNNNDLILKDSVNIFTIHRAKGLEFENVHLYGDFFRYYNIQNYLDGDVKNIEKPVILNNFKNKQESNLYYVALTRSKKNIYLIKK